MIVHQVSGDGDLIGTLAEDGEVIMPFIQEARVPDGGQRVSQHLLGFGNGANEVRRHNTMGNDEFRLILEDQSVDTGDALIEIVMVAVGDGFDFIDIVADFNAAVGVGHVCQKVIPPHNLVTQAVGKVGDKTDGQGFGRCPDL